MKIKGRRRQKCQLKSAKDRLKMSKYADKLILGDCRDVVKEIDDNSVHLILSDIPYGIGVDDWDVLHDNTNSAFLGSSPAQVKAGAVFKKRGKPLNGWSESDRQISYQYYEWCLTWVKDWMRVLKPGGSAIVFAGRRMAHRCICAFEDSEFTYKDMLAWLKDKAPHRAQRLSVVYEKRGDTKSAATWEGWRVGNLRPTYEPILWFTKPYKIGGTIADNMLENEVGAYNEKAFLKYVESPENMVNIISNGTDSGLHPTQKPLKLMLALIELTSKEDHVVLDPFCGSGTTIIAAASLGRKYIGIEINEEFFQIATKRLSRYKENKQNEFIFASK